MSNDMNRDFSAFVPDVTFEKIPIKNLVSNQDYQRNLSESHIIRAAKDFDLHQINPIKVSRRDGINYVFNGQHTIEIVATVSGSRDTPVWCMIYQDLSYQHEAHIFADQQKYVKPLIPYETFVANIEAGSEKQLMILDLVRSYNLDIGSNKAPGIICAVGALEYIFDKYGYHVLDRALRLCVGTWEGEAYSLTANMLKGIARIVAAFGDTLREDAFKDRVGQYSVKVISRNAKDRRAGALGFAEAMIMAYNRKSKYRLSLRKLYGNSTEDDFDGMDDTDTVDDDSDPEMDE